MQQQLSGGGRCEVCSGSEPLFLHVLPYRGHHRHVCTACVLAAHPGSFCPICFDVYLHNSPPPPRLRILCLKCPSISHLSCSPSHAHSPYLCPPCSNPNFTFFNISRNKPVRIDLHLAKQLLAAAKIAFESINNAAVIARINAEFRVKEALLAKAEASKLLMSLLDSDNKQKKTCEPDGSESDADD